MRSIHPIAAAAVAAWLALAGAARAEEPAAPPAAPETAAPAPPETAEPAKAEAATPGKPHKRRRKPAEEPLPPPAPPAPVAAAAPPVPVPAPQPPAAAAGPEPWSEGVMLRRLCGDGLRPNEEDRLFGMISLTVRSTIRYEGAKVSEELVGGAAEDAVSGLIAACPRLLAAAERQRLGIAIEVIRDATRQRIAQGKEAPTRRLAARMPGRKTAADLSEALTPHEVDAWLDGLPPRQRALALFLYASDVTAKEEAEALGLPLAAVSAGAARSRQGMLSYFRDGEDGAATLARTRKAAPDGAAPSSFAALLEPARAEGAAPPAAVRITGISPDLYAGWSLLAAVTGLPREQTLGVAAPFVVERDGGGKRLIVTASAEITKPEAATRRFLLKAYTIDGDTGVGLHETLHFAAATVDNPEALKTLANPNLSNVEIARCLWHDYRKADDPGLCR